MKQMLIDGGFITPEGVVLKNFPEYGDYKPFPGAHNSWKVKMIAPGLEKLYFPHGAPRKLPSFQLCSCAWAPASYPAAPAGSSDACGASLLNLRGANGRCARIRMGVVEVC